MFFILDFVFFFFVCLKISVMNRIGSVVIVIDFNDDIIVVKDNDIIFILSIFLLNFGV